MCPETLEEFPIADGGDELHEVERFEVRGSFEPFFFSNVFRLVFDIDVRFVDDDQIKSGRKGLELRWNVLNLVDSAAMHGSSLKYAWLSVSVPLTSPCSTSGRGCMIRLWHAGRRWIRWQRNTLDSAHLLTAEGIRSESMIRMVVIGGTS